MSVRADSVTPPQNTNEAARSVSGSISGAVAGSDSDSDSDSNSDQGTFSLYKGKSSRTRLAANPNRRSKPEQVQSVEDPSDALVQGKFEQLGLSPWLQQACESLGIFTPTPIQAACIPRTLKENTNVLGHAQTGSGKTAAFALPILEKLSRDIYGVYAVVLTPTRELAFQITDQFNAFGSGLRIRCETVVGGVDMLEQAIALKARPHVVVATPGRLAAHLTGAEPPYLRSAKFLVLDEADRLLTGKESVVVCLRIFKEISLCFVL